MLILKYARRYILLLVLALLIIPINLLITYQRSILTTISSSLVQPSGVTVVRTQALYDIQMQTSDEGWAVGGIFNDRLDPGGRLLAEQAEGGLIWHYQHGVWRSAITPGQPLLSLALAGTNEGWAVGYSGALWHFNGQTWKQESSPTEQTLRAVVALSAYEAWAVGFGGVILHYTGQNWQSITSPVTANLRSIDVQASGDGWIAGADGTLLHYQHKRWVQVASPTTAQLNRVSMLSSTEGWAVGVHNTLLHYRAGVWATVSIPGSPASASAPELYGITMTSLRSGWLIGGSSLLEYSHEIWQPVVNNLIKSNDSTLAENMALYSISMLSPHEGWIVGTARNAILLLHYQDGIWQAAQYT